MKLEKMEQTVGVGDVTLEVTELGQGSPLLFLHGEDGLRWSRPLLDELAAGFTVHAPHHPGWGGSTRPAHLTEVRDLALVYAEYLERLGTPAVVIGCSVGAWIAAELALVTRVPPIALVLGSPIGIKLGARDERDYEDIYMAAFDALPGILYGDSSHAPSLRDLPDEDYVYLAAAQEATARYCWKPYMHNPKLRYWLRRVAVPTLVVAGDSDRFALQPDFYKRYAGLLGPDGAALETLPGAGHRIEEEKPLELAGLVREFVAASRVG